MPAIHLLVNTFEIDSLGFEVDARLRFAAADIEWEQGSDARSALQLRLGRRPPAGVRGRPRRRRPNKRQPVGGVGLLRPLLL